jgi:hypothetical protein
MAIRPTIYVGLGGTGIRAIAQTKKHYEDAYGKDNIPQQIAFLAIDFDLAAANDATLATDVSSDFLSLRVAADPRTLYAVGSGSGDYTWMFPGNTGFIANNISEGASQVRTTGRFYTEMIISQVQSRLQRCWTRVTAIGGGNANVVNGKVDIHVVMSLAGGTGCGSFINVADIIRNLYGNNAHLVGYGVMHGVFRTMDPNGVKTPRVVANTYSAILDLDYLMNASPDNKIQIEINNQKKELDYPIFDEFFVVDNRTEAGHTIEHISHLCEVIGNCLFAIGGDMGTHIISGMNNTNWKNGQFNISPKKGWVQALGGCQVVYKGELLAQIYGCKAAIELIRKMIQEGADASQYAQNWTEFAKVREDGDVYNMLIDSIVSPEKIAAVKLPVVDVKDSITETKSRVHTYISKLVELPETEDLEKLAKEKEELLNSQIDQMLRQDNGVGNVAVFLRSLRKMCETYKGEMTTEAAEFKNRFNERSEVLAKHISEYEDYCNRLIAFKGGKEERLDMVSRVAKEMLQFNYEKRRREVAKDIFISLLNVIEKASNRIATLVELLKDLRDDYETELNNAQNRSASSLVFEYDLSTEDRLNMKLEDGEVSLSGLIVSLGDSLWNLDVNEQLKPAIDAYVAELPRALEYKNILITDVIDRLDDAKYNDLKFAIETKSSRLLPINDRGQVSKTNTQRFPSAMLVQNFLVSLYRPNDAKTRLESDDTFMQNLSKSFLSSTFDSMRQKIIVYRADYAVIPYCIDSFDELTVQTEYSTLLNDSTMAGSASFNPHFDRNIFEQMRNSDFKLKPEIMNEAMLYWVCGHIFGWRDVKETAYLMEKDSNGNTIKIESKEDIEHPKYIRFMNKGYYFWQEASPSQGKNDKWYPVGGSVASHRQRAFDNFKVIDFPRFKNALLTKIEEDIRSRGIDYYIQIVNNIIKDGKNDYIDRLACTDKNSATYYSQNSSDIAQFDAEWNYIEKHLIGALKQL